MSAKFRSVSTATNTDGVDQGTLTVTLPSQTADGDTMIAVTGGFTGSVTFVAPTGWRLMHQVDDSTGLQSRLYLKTAASEPASQNWQFTSGTGGAINISVASFIGAHDLLHYAARVTTAQTPAEGYELDAARDAVAWNVYCWRNDTANATCTGSLGTEKHDVTAKSATAIRRGQAGYYYGVPDVNDVINIGATMPDIQVTPSTTPVRGIHWNILVGDIEPDAETWSSTNGDFDVDLKLDVNAVDSIGGLTSLFRGDVTGDISAATSSAGANESLAFDGLTSTHWFAAATTGWLQYDFGVGVTKKIKRYRLSSSASEESRDPMNWTLKGSNNGVDFTVVDTRTNQAFGTREDTREFKLNGTPAAYRYYRLDITANKSSGAVAFVRVAEYRLSTIDAWEDITTFVQEEQKIRITRGLQGTSGRSDYTRAYVTLDNTDGRFSIRNQEGEYFGALQRNTQMRISKAYGTKTLQLQGDVQLEGTNMSGDGVRTPLSDGLTIDGDLDVRIDLEPDSWRDEQMLAGVSPPVSVISTWNFNIRNDGRLQFTRDPISANVQNFESTIAVPQASRQAVRATLDVNNGAGGSTVTFYTSDTISGSWTQLGDPVITTASTANNNYEGGALCVGHVGSEVERGIHGLVYHFELRDGIAGTLVTDIDFTALANGTHAFTDSNSNNWITVNNAVVSNRRYRFHGEVAEWPVAWDTTGSWVEVSATGAGVQRRLERGASEESAMYRQNTKGIIQDPGAFERFAEPFAYWPMEDGKNVFQIASAVPSGSAMTISGGPPVFESNSDFHESKALPKLANAKFGGKVSDNPSGYADIRWIMNAPTAITAGANILNIYSSGGSASNSVNRFSLDYEASNTWRLRGFDESDSGAVFRDSGNISVTTVGEFLHAQLILDQNSLAVDWTLNVFDVYGTSVGGSSGSFAASIMGRPYRINVNDDDTVTMNEVYFGHLSLYGTDSPFFADPFNAWHYETAGARIKRLCAEEEIEFRYAGPLGDSAFLGYQDIEGPFAVMSSAAVSDHGYLIDPLDAFGIEYKTVRSTMNQVAHLTLSYTGNELSGELLPVADDSYIVNDYTASRGDAGSARFRLTTGALSVNPPPTGVGEYADSQSFSLAHEGQCVDIASWNVHQGTLDEDHFPRIEVALENLRVSASSTLTESILKIDVGDRVDITNTPDFLPSEDIRQIVIGYEEWFDNFQHNLKLNTIPERAFETAGYDSDDRFAPDGSTLYQDVTAAASTIEVVNQTGQPWSDTATDFDIVINGERMTVTSVVNVTAYYSTDSFNRANSTTSLGSTDGGTVQAWTQDSGTWGINTNTAYISAAGSSIATVAGNANVEEVSVTASTLPAGAEFWINFRLSDTSNRWRWGGTQGASPRLEKVVAGVVTTYTAEHGFTVAQGDKMTARCHGSVIEAFQNDRLALCISDTFNESAIRVGMQLAATTVRLDNFVVIATTPRQTFTVTRGVGPSTGAYHKSESDIALYKTPYRGL